MYCSLFLNFNLAPEMVVSEISLFPFHVACEENVENDFIFWNMFVVYQISDFFSYEC